MSLKESIIDRTSIRHTEPVLIGSSVRGAKEEGEKGAAGRGGGGEGLGKEKGWGGGSVSQDVPVKQSGKYFSRHSRE